MKITKSQLRRIIKEELLFVLKEGMDVKVIDLGPDKQNPLKDLAKYTAPGKVTIVDFFTDWCRPCKRLAKDLEVLMKKIPDMAVRKIDVTGGPPAMQQHKIRFLPTIFIYDASGNFVKRYDGAPPDGTLEEIIIQLGGMKPDLPEPTQRKLAGSETAIDPTKPDQSTSDWGGWMKSMRNKNARRY